MKYLSRDLRTRPLHETELPVPYDASLYPGSQLFGEDGAQYQSDGKVWRVVVPQGVEVMLPPWVDTPAGWFDTVLEAPIPGRRIVSNRFDLSYVTEDVLTWVISSSGSLFSDAAGTIPIFGPGAPIGRAQDISSNDLHWTQEVGADRPIYNIVNDRPSIIFNQVNQRLEIEFTTSHTGTMIICTGWGTYWLDISVSPGAYTYGRWERMPIEEVIIMDRVLTAGEKDAFIGFLVEDESRKRKPFMGRIGDFSSSLEGQWRDRADIINFPLLDFGGVTSMSSAFRSGNSGQWLFSGFLDSAVDVTIFLDTFLDSQLTSIPSGLFDNCPNATNFINTLRNNQLTSIPSGLFDNNPNVETFQETFRNNQLASIPLDLFDNNPNVTNFEGTFRDNQITTVPPNLFDTQTQCTNYDNCFRINALTQESVDNILVSIAFSADQNDLDDGTLGIDGGTNATPGPAGQAAADALRARGWTVNLNGY